MTNGQHPTGAERPDEETKDEMSAQLAANKHEDGPQAAGTRSGRKNFDLATNGGRLASAREGEPRDIFAKKVGVSLTTVANYEIGRRIAPATYLTKILELRPHISPAWLLRGTGSRELDASSQLHDSAGEGRADQEKPASPPAAERVADDVLRGRIAALMTQLDTEGLAVVLTIASVLVQRRGNDGGRE